MNKLNTGCWLWRGYIMPSGYGQAYVGGEKKYVHRLFWEDANGPVPAGHIVRHSCGNRSCVSPGHLFAAPATSNRTERPEPAVRFWAKVRKTDGDGCWLWTASVGTHGYGQFKDGGTMSTAPRFIMRLLGVSIPSGFVVCHHCDNRLCVRPEHLFIGTQADNMQDASRKGRTTYGEHSGTAKLTSAQVLAIRNDGRSQHAVAADYGISQAQVWRIKRRKQWAHL